MFRIINKNIRKFLKLINKCSPWFKLTLTALIILITVVIINKYQPKKEHFIQQNKFVMKQGADVYDSFYATIYNDLVYDNIKNEYEIGEIINTTHPTEQSLILDIGSGTGQHVAALNDKGYPAVGLDLSPGMVGQAKKKFPGNGF